MGVDCARLVSLNRPLSCKLSKNREVNWIPRLFGTEQSPRNTVLALRAVQTYLFTSETKRLQRLEECQLESRDVENVPADDISKIDLVVRWFETKTLYIVSLAKRYVWFLRE